MTDDIDWIAADWGTTRLRLWAMAGRRPVARREDARGMGALRPQDFPEVLAQATEGWPAVPVIACGMVGARQGWFEAPYAAVPCPAAPQLVAVPGDTGGRDMRIVCGLRQDDPADVMRGEETQIAGLLAAAPDFDGVVCLPGTHTKWARVSASEICNFKTAMTGEIFALLAERSVLRHSVGGDTIDMPAFLAAVSDAMTRPERGYGDLFGLRAQALLQGLDPAVARARLSGTLIGWDLAATRPWWLGSDITVIGTEGLAALYAEALRAQGLSTRLADAEDATLAGLTAAHDLYLKEG